MDFEYRDKLDVGHIRPRDDNLLYRTVGPVDLLGDRDMVGLSMILILSFDVAMGEVGRIHPEAALGRPGCFDDC